MRSRPLGRSAARPAVVRLDFEYGDDFARHIEAFNPTFCKVLVRYNPEGDRALNRRQADRLRRLSEYLPTTRESAVAEIARRYQEFVDIFERARPV
jgi:myo-inositol catabolism protein IolC